MPVALDGPLLTIRRFPRHPLDMEQLIGMGAITAEAASFLQTLVRARYNLFICGGTGSGKTTFLNVLSAFIPPGERIVTIEDSAELQLSGIENLARLETRNANTEGRGGVSMKSLIRTSLRMRPDRIIVGEVRGEEAFDMLQAMNTGHDGSMSTGHANSTDDMMTRLETMVLMAADLPLAAIRKQIASALEVVVFLQRLRDHSRRVVEIAEVTGCDADGIRLQPLFTFQEEPDASLALNDGLGQKDLVPAISGQSQKMQDPAMSGQSQKMQDSAISGQLQKIQDPEKVTGRLQATGIPLKRTGKMRLHGFTGWA
jgi:pilus assembly protein CpaF